jgi:hypothetical protein
MWNPLASRIPNPTKLARKLSLIMLATWQDAGEAKGSSANAFWVYYLMRNQESIEETIK